MRTHELTEALGETGQELVSVVTLADLEPRHLGTEAELRSEQPSGRLLLMVRPVPPRPR